MSATTPSQPDSDSDGWPVSCAVDDLDYRPVPRSWLVHPAAEDRDLRTGPKLLAVSAARYGSRTLRVRYAHPWNGKVLVCQTGGIERDGGVVPEALENRTGWPRSLRPGPSDPHDQIRSVEIEHMQQLWSGVLNEVPDHWTHVERGDA